MPKKNDKTYELRIFALTRGRGSPPSPTVKDKLKSWLSSHGCESFVEGSVQDIDIDHEYGMENSAEQLYTRLGGDQSPISIFKYSAPALKHLRTKVETAFGKSVRCEMLAAPTESWKEGWKDSFKAFSTSRFFVYPPWIKHPTVPRGKKTIIIEPGMAFGTGQHATTKLCLKAIERLSEQLDCPNCTFLDVGTGSGILAIGASKLGYRSVIATDIDPDAVLASKQNAKRNRVRMRVSKASVPRGNHRYHVVVANILTHVLENLIPSLGHSVHKDGHLILSGLLNEHEDFLVEKAERKGLRLEKTLRLQGWSCLILKKMGRESL